MIINKEYEGIGKIIMRVKVSIEVEKRSEGKGEG